MKKYTILFALILIYIFANAQTADEIIAKYIKKTGGLKAWKAVKSIKKTSIVDIGHGESQNEVLIRTKEGCFYLAVKNNDMPFVGEAFDGETAWGSNNETMELEEKGEETLKRLKRIAKEFPSIYITYKSLGYKFELLGEEKIEGIDCYKLELIKGKEDVDKSIHFISKENYEVVVVESNFKDEKGMNIVCSAYSDFKKVNGLTFPYFIKRSIQGAVYLIKTFSLEINSEIDKSIFEFDDGADI
jgi:outer membrane lipoprotein-sorting protein